MNSKWLLPLACLLALTANCGKNPYQAALDLEFASGLLTVLPCQPEDVVAMQPFGVVPLSSEPFRSHNGIDLLTTDRAPFFSCAPGRVEKVIFNTGVGLPGTNYRIHIRVNRTVVVDYHFEINGSRPESEQRACVFVAEGDYVRAGQHIADLIVLGDAAHVHFGIMEGERMDQCPLRFFSAQAAARFEAMYDQPQVEKRPDWRENLCE
jgi:murein DD-endopeptidase MepM/ murein hydrolase activator NlpD